MLAAPSRDARPLSSWSFLSVALVVRPSLNNLEYIFGAIPSERRLPLAACRSARGSQPCSLPPTRAERPRGHQ